MKVLLLNGSPNANGCINEGLLIMAKEFEKENIDYEIVQIGKKAIQGCIGCGTCRTKGECVFGDIANDIVKKLETYNLK